MAAVKVTVHILLQNTFNLKEVSVHSDSRAVILALNDVHCVFRVSQKMSVLTNNSDKLLQYQIRLSA